MTLPATQSTPTIHLRDFQREAAALLARQILEGGDMKFNAPIGTGRTIILAEALRGLDTVAFVSRSRAMREQTVTIFERMGLSGVTLLEPKDDLSPFTVVVLSEELRDLEISHPCVVRM